MGLHKTWSVMRKEFWHIFRDRRTAFLVLTSPAIFLITMAYSLSVEIRQVPIAVLDRDQSRLSRSYLAALTNSGELVDCFLPANYQDIEHLLIRGDAKAAVVIPPGFMRNLEAGHQTGVQLVVDGTDPNTAGHAITHLTSRTEHFITALMSRRMGELRVPREGLASIDLRLRAWYNPGLKFKVGMVPALLAVVLGMPAVSASLAVAREKEWGTLEGLFATPLGRAELLVGKLIPYVGSGLLSTVLCAAIAVYWFGVPFRGSFPLFLLLSTDFLFATLSIALLISTLVSSQQVAMIASLLTFLFPGFFLSGVFFPISGMAPIMKMEALAMPTTHLVFIARGIMVKGLGLRGLWGYGTALFVMGMLMIGLTILLFKKKLG